MFSASPLVTVAGVVLILINVAIITAACEPSTLSPSTPGTQSGVEGTAIHGQPPFLSTPGTLSPEQQETAEARLHTANPAGPTTVPGKIPTTNANTGGTATPTPCMPAQTSANLPSSGVQSPGTGAPFVTTPPTFSPSRYETAEAALGRTNHAGPSGGPGAPICPTSTPTSTPPA